ncbi:MAG: TonB-dependent receptor plug domain-containing protein [Flavobacteriia bacterium]|nr:TonB-dependent receptor plug domain-containing protein [Flavobacteriia bacterium]
MKFFTTFFITIFSIATSYSQDHTVRGFVYEKKNGEPILFEKVVLLNVKDSTIYAGATTDVNGFFTIPKVAIGTYILRIDNDVYIKVLEKVEVKTATGITNLKFELVKPESSITELEETVIKAETQRKKTSPDVSQIKLDKKAVERIPSIGAENDIVGAVSVTPGVITTGDQGGQMYVRGGTPIQNKILLDGMTIYQPYHSIGFFSIFETELIKNVDICTGGFDAKYGERISSVMDITYKDGNKKEFGGKLSVSPFLAKVVLEGPFKKQKDGSSSPLSFLLTGKHSLLDATSKTLYPRVNDGNGLPFNFTDLYGKVTYSGGSGSKVNFFGFHLKVLI